MIPDIIELNFPKKDGKQYATLTQATANIADMGEKSITTQIKIDGEIVPDFSFDWAVEFQGEKYIMPLRIPQGAKENTSLNSTIDLTFQHWAIYQLKRWPFVTIQQIAAGTYLPDEEEATVQLNLKDFCILFGQVLDYYYGGAITIDLNPAWQYKHEAIIITISHTKIWNVLIDAFHDKYGVRWEIKAASDNNNTVKGGERYVIRVGYPTTEVDHIFEYGFEGGLLKVERQVQSEEIRNMLKGRGGETNIPRFYFKQVPDAEKEKYSYSDDPDWVEELANIYFPNLMPATFRSYIQGWKAAHINQTDADGKKIYAGYTPIGEANTYAPWAYRKGYTDTKFAPVEFVADEITIDPATGDKQVEILPGYSPYVKKGSSLDKYGPLPDTLDNNEDIYPTLQGTGMDIAVDVEQITTDTVPEEPASDAETYVLDGISSADTRVAKGAYAEIALQGGSFTVPPGMKGNLDTDSILIKAKKPANTWLSPFSGLAMVPGTKPKDDYITVVDSKVEVTGTDGSKRSASGVPPGDYTFEITVEIQNTSDMALDVKAECPAPTLTVATPRPDYTNTFDIWIKNVWETAKRPSETNTEYSERVWKPVLGDREGNTAKVMFTSGDLAMSEDYEFTIVDYPTPDTEKTYTDADGVEHISHWRIKLAKSDAELEATGLYVPSTQKQGKAGDTFVFIGTEMTHVPYVVDAEIRLDDGKKDRLGEVKEIKPTFVVKTDRVRLNNEGRPGALIDQLRVGNTITIRDSRLIGGSQQETLYLQSITYTYREPSSEDAALNPDVDITLGTEYATTANPISMMQGEINALQRHIGSVSNIEQVVNAVGDRKYLRKDRSDRTPYALAVGEKLTAEGGVQFGPVFAEGITGFGGKVDGRGRAWLESLVLRGFLEVPYLSFNRTEISVGNDWNAPGGGTLESVEPGRDTDGSPLRTGKATLRLEDGELGAVAAGDICMGIWHDTFNTVANSTEDSDDSKGNFRFSGFRTVCFRITEILEQGDNSAFAYELREGSLHPSAQMTFVSYGSFTREDRRTSRYSTRTYTRYLRGVDTWEFRAENVAAQFGDLSNLSVFGLDMTGYSVYLDNVYMKGTIQSVGLSRFWLESSAQQVVRHADGTVTPATLTAKGWRKDSTGAVSEHGTVSYLTATGASGTVPAAGLATRGLDFPVTLRLTGTGVDTGVSLTVSEARDGTDGTPGTYTENLLFGSADFSPLYTVFPPHTDGEWFTYYTDYVSISQSEQLDGRPTVRARKTDADTAQYVGIRQFVDVSGFGDGEAFTLGFRTLVKDASLFDDDAYAELNFYDEGMSRIRSFGHSIPAATNAGERTHVFSDTKPAGARHAEVSLFLIHNGEIWFGSPKLSKGAQEEYAWTPNPADLRGKDGEDGTSVGISSTAVRYQASASGTAAPTGTWLASAPSVPAGQYLWTRTTVSYTDGSSTVSYSVSRQGEDGESGTYTENLLKGTRGFSGSGWQNLSAWEADGTYGDLAVMKRTGAWQGIRQPFAAEAGDTFIFSAFVKADGGAPIYFYSNKGTATTTPDSLRIYPEPGGWKRFEYRFTATTAGTVVPRVEASADTGTLRVAGLKLERGFTQKSAWTPNSEDLRGGQGLDGAVMRITEWEAGKKYYDGRTETDGDPGGPRFLDIVTRTAADGMSRTIWQCVMTHTAAKADSPGSGGAAAYWQQFSSVTPIYTPLLLADNAKITFLNTQEIVVTVDGEVVGRFGGGETPLWVGGATAATAKFALAETGKVRFGKDGGQRVELDPSTNGMSIYDGEGRKTEFRGERVADMAGIFKAASLTVSGRVASGSISSDEQQTKSQRVATVNAATAGNLKVSCTLSLTSGHEYASASAEVYVTDSSGSRVWADSLASEGGTGPKSKAVAADIYLPAAGTYYVQASLRARKYDYYAPGSDLSQGPTQTYNSSAGWSGLAVSGEGTVYKAQYLSNGWAIGNGSGSYASVWEDASGKMCFAALCGGKGLMVSPDGARVNHGNGWGTVPRALVSGWVNWSGIASSTSYSWAWRSNGDGLVIGSPSRIEAGKVFIPLPSGMPDPSRLSVQVTGRYTPLETAIGDMSGKNVSVNGVNRGPGLTVLLSRGGTATDSGFMITISEI